MAKLTIKLLLMALAIYGAVNVARDVTPWVRDLLGAPEIARSPSVKSAIDTANQILPANQQLSLPTPQITTGEDEVTKTITQIITEKLAETATLTTDNLKQSAHNQVCREILTKVIDQCGTPD